GVDVLATDKLGTLSLSPAGCKERDEYVLKKCRDMGIPVQCSMGGGYSKEIKVIVEAHANTFRLAQEFYF
ncbi:MAG: histone deacetylase, partial [Flavobacteriaceae bacterium]|nr:histone deacetylase [Flavobacteriaceae bacterium]